MMPMQNILAQRAGMAAPPAAPQVMPQGTAMRPQMPLQNGMPAQAPMSGAVLARPGMQVQPQMPAQPQPAQPGMMQAPQQNFLRSRLGM